MINLQFLQRAESRTKIINVVLFENDFWCVDDFNMKLNNKYYILRHGEAVSNERQIVSSWPETFKNPLTHKGVAQVKKAARRIKHEHIDLLFSSDLLRTKQTAQLVAKILNSGKFDKSSATFKKVKVTLDKRLREVSFGDINGKSAEELLYMGFGKDRVNKGGEKSESYGDVLRRVFNFFTEINHRYQRKHILIISHQCPLWVLENKLHGIPLRAGLKKVPKEKRISKGEIRELTTKT